MSAHFQRGTYRIGARFITDPAPESNQELGVAGRVTVRVSRLAPVRFGAPRPARVALVVGGLLLLTLLFGVPATAAGWARHGIDV
ncbi:hypothetical protein [Micromonospora avicenniae]|uniref:hypothetical protein n=1 Tax=Micromonospora avicenniae TaxID=1198245 RepID=UPI0033257282